jgi:hypothetical protein
VACPASFAPSTHRLCVCTDPAPRIRPPTPPPPQTGANKRSQAVQAPTATVKDFQGVEAPARITAVTTNEAPSSCRRKKTCLPNAVIAPGGLSVKLVAKAKKKKADGFNGRLYR